MLYPIGDYDQAYLYDTYCIGYRLYRGVTVCQVDNEEKIKHGVCHELSREEGEKSQMECVSDMTSDDE